MGVLPFDLRFCAVAGEWSRLFNWHPESVVRFSRFPIDDLGVDLAPVGVGVDVDILSLELERFSEYLSALSTVYRDEPVRTQLGEGQGAAILEASGFIFMSNNTRARSYSLYCAIVPASLRAL